MRSLSFTTGNQVSFSYVDIIMILKDFNRLTRFGGHAVVPNKFLEKLSHSRSYIKKGVLRIKLAAKLIRSQLIKTIAGAGKRLKVLL